MASSSRQQHQRQQAENMLQSNRHDNHFKTSSNSTEQGPADTSYRSVVPKEYDYMAGSASRSKPPIKLEVVNRQAEDQQQAKAWQQPSSTRPQRQVLTPRQRPSDEYTSLAMMYEPLETVVSGSSRQERRTDATSRREDVGVAASERAREEKKNAFWDCIDDSMWVADEKVTSCMHCQKDFKLLTRRRHHCRKCGKIFCSSCSSMRKIENLEKRICAECADAYENYTKSSAGMLLQRANQLEYAKQQQLTSQAEQDYQRMVSESMNMTDGGSTQVAAGSVYNDHMQHQFQSSDKLGTPSSLGFAPILDQNASLMSDQDSVQGPCYMDQEFNNRGNCAYETSSQASSEVNQFNHLNKNGLEKLGEYSRRHIQKVVTEQLFLNELSCKKWEVKLTDFVLRAVESVKPSSRMLGDNMDINRFVKVKIIDWRDNSKSQYINGLVMSKSIASRRMQAVVPNPRILLLKSIGQDEGGSNKPFINSDLATKINAEDHSEKIMQQKLTEINPNLVIVQRDIPVKLLNMMRDRDITVVCNLDDKKINRLARLLQTILLPSINVIDGTFSLGICQLFREDNLTRQAREQGATIVGTHNVEQTLLTFEGCNPQLGCTICLSGPISKEGKELIQVKKALKSMLVLARNIVLERHFLLQIQCQVPEPPFAEADDEKVNNLKSSGKAALEDILGKWEMTDMYSPYLITNFVQNRSTLVYKRIKIILKQRDESIPNGPSAYDSQDILHTGLDNTLGEFMREANVAVRLDTFADPHRPEDEKVDINEKFVQTKLDKMCGQPTDAILYFSRQDLRDPDKKKRNDQTLGRYLEELCETAKKKCDECHVEKHLHSQEIYHRDGQIQITIRPQQMAGAHVDEQMITQTSSGQAQQDLFPQLNPMIKQQYRQANQRRTIMIYAQCKTCLVYSERSQFAMQLYEYSKARFFEQFFYNDKLKVKSGVFKCEHGSHPLRDYIIEFLVDQTKIRFCYTAIDTYRIQYVTPQKYPQHDALRRLIEQRKEKLQDVLEEALDHFKHDQIEKLKGIIEQTLQQHEMDNESKFRGTNMPVFVANFERLLVTLEKMKDDFREFQEEAAKELAKFKDELLLLMFLQRKILMTFLGYQRTIDEVIQQMALLIVIARRRAQVIDYQLSKADCDARSALTMIEGDEMSLTVASQSQQPQTGFQSRNTSMAELDESNGSIVETVGVKVASSLIVKMLSSQNDIVTEEVREDESDNSVSVKGKRRESGDDMASVGVGNDEENSSDLSETSIHRMEESFGQNRARTRTNSIRMRSSELGPKRGSLSRTDKQKPAMLNSMDDVSSVGSSRPSKRIFGKLQRQQLTGTSSVKSSGRGNDTMARGKRKLMDSGITEDSMMELDLEEEVIPRDAQKRCFIEELCTCEITENQFQQTKNQHNAAQQFGKRLANFNPSMIPRVSNSVKIATGEFKNMLTRQLQSQDSHVNVPSATGAIERKEDGIGSGVPAVVISPKEGDQKLNAMAQSMHTEIQKIGSTGQVAQNVVQMGYAASHQLHHQHPPNRPQQQKRGVTYCYINGQFSGNKYCSNIQHVAVCYQQIVKEVHDTRIQLQKVIYKPAEASGYFNQQTTTVGGREDQQIIEEDKETVPGEFIEQKIGFMIQKASQIEGFDTIAIERKVKDTLDPTDGPAMFNAETNRQGGDLRQQFDFIAVPKNEPQKRGESPNAQPKELAVKGENSGRAAQSPQRREQPVQDPWLMINWLTKLAKKSYPTLPLGFDNTSLKVNPQDIGSIIAYAMTSNIYIEGLSKVKYMGLDEILLKQQEKSSHQGYELLDQDDVLNHNHVDKNRIEAMMLSRNKISFALKFSTHSKDVSMTVKEERQKQTYNHSTRTFKTGYTEKRMASQPTTLAANDLQSEAGSTSDYSQTIRSAKGIKGAAKGKKPKKVFNDYHLRVLPKYPKEYLRCGNIMEVINELYEVQSDLCLTYFSQEQIGATNCFLNNCKDLLHQQQVMMKQSVPNKMNHSPDTTQNMHNHSHMIENTHADLSRAYDGGADFYPDESIAYLAGTHDISVDMIRNEDFTGNMMYASAQANTMSAPLGQDMTGKLGGRAERRRLKKRQKQDPIIELGLEEGTIFGVKSPATSISEEQNQAINFINDGLKIPKIDFEVTLQYPKRFQAMRRFYVGTHLDYINSICKTNPFKSTGGKASMGFLTSHDKKFIFKSVKKDEFENFCHFAPNYFDYLNRCFFHNHACALAKIVGAYDIKITCASDPSLSQHVFFLVSENLNLGIKKEDEQNIIRYDLKGSENNRLVNPPIGLDGLPERVVLLDNNFLFKMRARPMVLTFDDAQLLHECVLQDTDLFRRNTIVDYSLLVIIDTRKKRVRFGILDYCQNFNKTKQLEYVTKKFVVNFGGLPTIVPPDLYEMRFSNFMISNFVGVGTQMRKRKGKSGSKSKKTTKEQVKQSVLKEDENIRKVLRQSRKFDELRANLIQKSITDLPSTHKSEQKVIEEEKKVPIIISTKQERNSAQSQLITPRSRQV